MTFGELTKNDEFLIRLKMPPDYASIYWHCVKTSHRHAKTLNGKETTIRIDPETTILKT